MVGSLRVEAGIPCLVSHESPRTPSCEELFSQVSMFLLNHLNSQSQTRNWGGILGRPPWIILREGNVYH